jgi:hypothetical protein
MLYIAEIGLRVFTTLTSIFPLTKHVQEREVIRVSISSKGPLKNEIANRLKLKSIEPKIKKLVEFT